MPIKIYGDSDDLIEIEGQIREEFNFFPDDENENRLLAVSDGTLLRINYDADGIWRITKIIGGTSEFSKIEGDVKSDTPDVVMLAGDIKWVALATSYAT